MSGKIPLSGGIPLSGPPLPTPSAKPIPLLPGPSTTAKSGPGASPSPSPAPGAAAATAPGETAAAGPSPAGTPASPSPAPAAGARHLLQAPKPKDEPKEVTPPDDQPSGAQIQPCLKASKAETAAVNKAPVKARARLLQDGTARLRSSAAASAPHRERGLQCHVAGLASLSHAHGPSVLEMNLGLTQSVLLCFFCLCCFRRRVHP